MANQQNKIEQWNSFLENYGIKYETALKFLGAESVDAWIKRVKGRSLNAAITKITEILKQRHRRNFDANWGLAESHLLITKQIIKQNLPLLIDLDVAPARKDMEEATDLILTVKGGDIAIRVRSRGYFRKHQDWTVRSRIAWTNRTEIDKLKDGFGDWYFYGWSQDNKGILEAWILIDLAKIRDCKLLETNRNDIPNGDGTFFRAYKFKELLNSNCIIAYKGEFHAQR